MRAAPAIEVIVSRFEVWRRVLIALGMMVGISPLWWVLSRTGDASLLEWTVAATAGLAGMVCVVSVRAENRVFALRWNGQRWGVAVGPLTGKAHRSLVTDCSATPSIGHMVGRVDADSFEEGEISIVIDFGTWMFLRFDPPAIPPNLEAAPAPTDVNLLTFRPYGRCRSRRLWLPLQRAGLEPQWPGLRRALYARAVNPLEASRPLNPRHSA